MAIFLSLIAVFPILLSSSFAQTSTNILNFELDLVEISILNFTVNKSPSGFVSVTGTVQNNSTEVVDHILVNVIFYDTNNNIEKEFGRFVSGPFTVYDPNSIERFSFIIGKEDYEYYEAKAFANIVI